MRTRRTPRRWIVTKTYVLNDALSVLSPPPSGENTKALQKEYDGLGRLTSSCLISSASGSALCGQANTKTGFVTQYSYDAAGRLLQTIENYQVSSPRQARTYTYDLLGRVLTEINPENGTTYYFYDTAPSSPGVACPGTYNGDLVKKYDAQGNTICYTYDRLHRVLTTTYPAGPNSGSTPTKNFTYDTTAFSCPTGSNVEGRMADAFTGTSGSKITDRAYCYSPRGEVTDIYTATPNSNGYYHIIKTYWPDGSLASLGVNPELPTIYYGGSDGSGLDGEGRVTKVTASSGVNPVTAVTYTNSGGSQPIGSLTQVTFGSTGGAGDSDSFSYDLNTSRMNQYTFTVNGQSVIGKPTWNANGTLGKLQIVQDPFDPANVQTCTYTYDDFVRVGGQDANGYSVDCGSAWQQLFTYDQFGNITKSGTSSWMPGYSLTNNHYTLGGTTYDNNGNLTNDTFHTYQWDAEGRMIGIGGSYQSNQTFDALGNLAEQNIPSPSYTAQYLHDEHGTELGFGQGQSPAWTWIPLPGGATAIYLGSTLQNYWHADWLGSARLGSTPARTLWSDRAYAPYGEPYAATGNTAQSFAGMKQNLAPDEYETPNREYNPTQGRWISPDPTRGTGNKYVYADNNPLSKVDPYGLDAIDISFQLWFESEMYRPDPVDESESNAMRSVQTPGIAESEMAYLDRVDEAFAATPQDQQKAQAKEEAKKGQPEQEQNQQTRADIASTANKYKDSTDWAYDKKKGTFACNTWKCNEFVGDVTKEAGAPAEIRGRYPLAGEWADTKTKIDNWRVLGADEEPQPGDVAAYKIPGCHGCTGHSGIVVGVDSQGVHAMAAHADVVGPDNKFQPTNPGVVYRRYTGDQQ